MQLRRSVVKVVVDTNILVSGIFWGGKPEQVLNLWRDGKIHLMVTKDILDEYLRVLATLGHLDEDLVSDWTDHMCKYSLMVLKTARTELCRDPSDNKFLECAISAHADCIISGDNDLLVLETIQGIPILNPSQFLNGFIG
jgi:uncharacterized protein